MSSKKRKREQDIKRDVRRRIDKCVCRRLGHNVCEAQIHYCICAGQHTDNGSVNRFINQEWCRSQYHIEQVLFLDQESIRELYYNNSLPGDVAS